MNSLGDGRRSAESANSSMRSWPIMVEPNPLVRLESATTPVPTRAEDADQAFGRRAGRFAELFKADRRLDVIAKDCLAGIDIAAQ